MNSYLYNIYSDINYNKKLLEMNKYIDFNKSFINAIENNDLNAIKELLAYPNNFIDISLNDYNAIKKAYIKGRHVSFETFKFLIEYFKDKIPKGKIYELYHSDSEIYKWYADDIYDSHYKLKKDYLGIYIKENYEICEKCIELTKQLNKCKEEIQKINNKYNSLDKEFNAYRDKTQNQLLKSGVEIKPTFDDSDDPYLH